MKIFEQNILLFLLGKVELNIPLNVQHTCHIIIELCNIRDGFSFCDGLHYILCTGH